MNNNKNLSFYSMVFLALALMGLILFTQLFTNKANLALKAGNIQAVETYKINNRMQSIVKLSYDLQGKLSTGADFDSKRINTLTDSITLLGTHTEVLNTAIKKLGYTQHATKIYDLITDQIGHSLAILVSTRSGNTLKRDSLVNDLIRIHWAHKVYASCLKVQKLLEISLEETLKKNTEQADMLSTYSRALAIVAILAILIMATIIVKRRAQQVKLIEELKMAELVALKSKNAKDEFVTNMSHELRTPLNALIGFSNLLKQSNLEGKQQEYVDIIRSGAYNLLNIVNDVLDLSKIEAGKLRLLNKPFNIRTVLDNTQKMFSASLAEKKLSYEWHVDEKVPDNLKGDSERLMQILVNLVGNAIKFTNTGGIQVNTGIVWVDEASGIYKLAFTVKDSGSGIPPEKIQTIFERFEQLEHVTTRQHGGTGLGLTIVKNLVERMGGSISAYSEVGVGSEFTFTCLFEKAMQAVVKEDKSIESEFSLEGYQILAAEDNGANQTLLKHLLAKYHASLTIVENGREVLDHLKKNHYDLLLMDIQMPLMDGYTTVKHIREGLKPDLKIIAMTAYVSEDEIQKCKRSGFNDYVAKPIDEADLINKIAGHLQQIPPSVKPARQADSVDFQFLKELVGDDESAISEIIQEMKTQWHLDKKELEAALKETNTNEIKRIMHRLKSTLSPLGPTHPVYLNVADKNYEVINNGLENKTAEYYTMIEKIDTFIETL